MLTRLSVFCDKLLEASWLAALLVAPLFFDVYSSRVFEPDKISFVRSLALVMIAAWLIRLIEAGVTGTSPGQALRSIRHQNPLVLATLAVVIAYLISTVFSLVPAVSFWGSYQRLQGTYTTFSYIAIFLIAASSLRTRAQLDRAINVAIVVSFPIAFYGLIQHFKLDTLPWGGDVTTRVAANMGNSIFVAAYLIMIVPLALARWMETLNLLVHSVDARRRPVVLGIAIGALAALIALWVFDFALGVGFALALLFCAALLAASTQPGGRNYLLLVTYTIVLAAQLVAIFFTQSRGPWLGLAGGLFAFVVLFALARGARRVMFGAIGLAIVATLFLGIFNLPNSPLSPLKNVPYVGRLGQLLETDSGTGKVRELIWQGAVKLVVPHQPLWSPTTGDDPLNALRPLVGYGPEAMYVAFNPFYPPELAHLESRNASPDRSHNETFDSLVMTGLLGFGAYILLFVSIFYFALKWLGVIQSPGERNAFLALWLIGGLLSSLAFGLWRGWNFVGVALPAGMIAGLLIFLTAIVLRRSRTSESAGDPRRALWLCALVAALIAHFVEIHFGIAIVSTRTYFWFYAALLIVLGMNRLEEVTPARVTEPAPPELPGAPLRTPAASRRRQRRRNAERARAMSARGPATDIPLQPILTWTAIAALIVLTLAFEFINNQTGVASALDAVLHSLFYKGNDVSLAIGLLFVLTWVIAGIVGLGEELRGVRLAGNGLALAIALFGVLSFTAFVWYVLFQARWLTQLGDLTDAFVGVLGLYYGAFFLLVAGLALALSLDLAPRGAVLLRAPANALVTPVSVFLLLALVYFTNFTGVSADVLYKAAGNFDNSGAWENSANLYQRALVLQPGQDYYSLFLGRAYLEGARASTDPAKRDQGLAKSEQVLLRAQSMNPLNMDHSANLARLHRIWGQLVDDPTQRALHYRKSSDYYEMATRLSPNTAYLYNEWSQTYSQSGDWSSARAKLEQSLALDSQFAQTYLYLGENYRAREDWPQAADNYYKAIALDPGALADADSTPLAGPMAVLARPDIAPVAIQKYRAASQAYPSSLPVHYALAELFKRSGQMDQARQELEQAVQSAPNDYLVRLALVNFYSENGQIDAAVTTMRGLMALLSPERMQDYQRFQDFFAQLQNLQKAIQTAKNSPDDVNAHRTVAGMWKARGQEQFALPEYKTVARLAPNDYEANKNIALLDLQLNQLDDAQRALVAAAALAPDNEKAMWQSLQAALNAHKAQQFDEAVKQAQAALALAGEPDRLSVQAYVTQLQNQLASHK